MAGQNQPDILFDLRANPGNEFAKPDEAARFVPGETRRLVGVYLPEPRSVAFYLESISGFGVSPDFFSVVAVSL